jgi:hypothetical protein
MTDKIIDHLCDDKKALAACSLVCKSWSPRARCHLFSNIQILIHNENARAFMKSGLSRKPFLHHLHIVIEWRYPPWKKVLRPLVGAKFNHIQSLSLTSEIPNIISSSELSTIADLFARVTYLKICKFYTRHFANLVHFICAFRNLETLVIDQPDWNRQNTDFPLSTHRLSGKLLALEVGDGESHVLVEWLLTLGDLPPLHTFYQHSTYKPRYFRVLGKVLSVLGPSLEAVGYTYYGTHLSLISSTNLWYLLCSDRNRRSRAHQSLSQHIPALDTSRDRRNR